MAHLVLRLPGFLAVHAIGVRRALGLLCRELAEVVHCEETSVANDDFDGWRRFSQSRSHAKQRHEDWIRSVNFEIQAPRVIRLLAIKLRSPKYAVWRTWLGAACSEAGG